MAGGAVCPVELSSNLSQVFTVPSDGLTRAFSLPGTVKLGECWMTGLVEVVGVVEQDQPRWRCAVWQHLPVSAGAG